MIQFNLLPDIKKQFIRAQRIKRIVIVVCVFASIVSIVIFAGLLYYVDSYQKNQLSQLSEAISAQGQQLKGNTNLNKILTIQNQLTTLPQLQAQTPAASRLLGYFNELTPVTASIATLKVDYTQNTMSVTGSATSLDVVNQFVDTLKFTTYKTSSSSTATNAFSTVVLSTFAYSQTGSSGKPAQYTITFGFDPVIFSNSQKVTLTVPQKTTTRSILGQPTGLFEKNATTTVGGA